MPIEQLTRAGMSPAFAAWLHAGYGWSAARIALFDGAFARYWTRSSALAARTPTWAPPRLRHVAVVRDGLAVRPYAQLLNTSAWTLYDSDLDPERSTEEFVAYLLVHGDRMALLGEVTLPAVHNAAYWFERTPAEREAFAAGAERASRPDADAYRALAGATGWLAELRHDTLRPPPAGPPGRPIPGTGLLVPRPLEARPPALIDRWATVARAVLARYHAAWQAPDLAAVTALGEWLAADRPPLLVMSGPRILWDPLQAERLAPLRDRLKRGSGAGVRDVDADLRVVAARTRAFHAALTDPTALPRPDPATEQRGYTYLHRARGVIVYDLDEPGIERLRGPALPYARAMLGARTLHEWAHLAVVAGWVPRVAGLDEFAAGVAALAAELDAVIHSAPRAVRDRTAADLAALSAEAPERTAAMPGTALAAVLLARLPDFQANLLAARFMDVAERETYVRHNVRTLRAEYPPARLWRMLVRYLVELQYLRFSAVGDRRAFFLRSTWFDADFLASGVLSEDGFDRLAAHVERLCACFAVDEQAFAR